MKVVSKNNDNFLKRPEKKIDRKKIKKSNIKNRSKIPKTWNRQGIRTTQ